MDSNNHGYNRRINGYRISRERLLTHEETAELVEMMKQGDKNARNKLITSNMGLIISAALKFEKNSGSLSVEDLIQEGVIIMEDLLKRYDPNKSRISTHIQLPLRSRLQRVINETSPIIRIPDKVRGRIKRFYKEKNKIYCQTGHMPRDEDILPKIREVKPDTIKEEIQLPLEVISLDAPIYESESGNYLSIIESPYKTPEEEAIFNDRREAVRRELQKLGENGTRERNIQIINEIYGIGEGRGMTSNEVALHYGSTKQNIQSIKKSVEGKLRERLKRENYD